MASRKKRRHDDKGTAASREEIDAKRQGRKEEGLNKIYGPEWGITELDFEADYKTYENEEMKTEYDGASKDVEPTAYQASRPGQQSVSGQAWMQEVSDRERGGGGEIERAKMPTLDMASNDKDPQAKR